MPWLLDKIIQPTVSLSLILTSLLAVLKTKPTSIKILLDGGRYVAFPRIDGYFALYPSSECHCSAFLTLKSVVLLVWTPLVLDLSCDWLSNFLWFLLVEHLYEERSP